MQFVQFTTMPYLPIQKQYGEQYERKKKLYFTYSHFVVSYQVDDLSLEER